MRVVLIDDHAVVREGLRELLGKEPDLTVVGEAGTPAAGMALVREHRPNVAVVDLALGREMGFSLLQELRREVPDMALLVLSMHDENVFAELALANGASGYVSKHESSAVILGAVRRVASGKVFLSETVAERLLGTMSWRPRRAPAAPSPVARLTDREVDVLRRIGLGRATAQIASDLHISTKTVETYRSRLKEKLAVRSGPELVVVAVNWVRDGVLDDPNREK